MNASTTQHKNQKPHRVLVPLHARQVYHLTLLIIVLEMGCCVIYTPNQHHLITRINLKDKSCKKAVTSTVRSGVYPTTIILQHNATQRDTNETTIRRDCNKKGQADDDKRRTTRKKKMLTDNKSNNKNKKNNTKKRIQQYTVIARTPGQQQEQLRKTTTQTTIETTQRDTTRNKRNNNTL